MSWKFNYSAPKKTTQHSLKSTPSTHLNIAQKYLNVLKTEEGCGFACEALKFV